MKHMRFITGFMTAVMLTGYTGNVYAFAAEKETVTSSEAIEASGNSVSVTEADEKVGHKEKDTSIEDTTYTYEYDTYSVDYTVTSHWDDRCNVIVDLRNNTDQVIHNWNLIFCTDDEIIDPWNAKIVSEDDETGKYLLKNMEYNQDVPANGSVKFGFQVKYGEDFDLPISFYMSTSEKCVEESDYKATVSVTSAWDGGYTAGIDIYNLRDTDIEDWLMIVQTENKITNMWNATLKSIGDDLYEISCPDHSQNIPGHEMKSVGFQAEGDECDLTVLCIKERNRIDDLELPDFSNWDRITDTDGDGVVDSLEEYFGTDINNKDSDSDGMSDREEVYITGTDPRVVDSDDNGIPDTDEDLDKDGLVNFDELVYGTSPFSADTDFDDLSDLEEIKQYFTDPLIRDTDSDGAPDGWELDNGYDPLVYNSSFKLSASQGELGEANPVIARVNLEASDVDVESLVVEKIEPHDNYLISPCIAGYIGDAYGFSIDGEFDKAELIFEYDVAVGKIGDDFQPRIYYLNEDTEMFEELEDQTVNEGKVTANTTHFSIYILLNKVEFDKAWEKSAQGALNNISGKDNAAAFDDISIKNKGEVKSYNGHKYLLIKEEMDWDNASDYCMSVGGHLVSITSEGEQNFINNNILEKSRHSAWIGGITYGSLDEFQWVTGEKMDYTYWNSGEPNWGDETRVHLYDWTGLWNNCPETSRHWFICEWDDYGEESTYDSNGDGISDYDTKLIEEGIITCSNTSDELTGYNLNYDENGNLSDDCDHDGLKNGEEIEIVEEFGKRFFRMKSHPWREFSDTDIWNDYEEVQNGTNPMKHEFEKIHVDALTNNLPYYYEGVADLRDDDFVKGIMGYSAVINGVWNRQEIYRDLIIDYFYNYASADYYEDAVLEEEKKQLYDALITCISNVKNSISNGKNTYDTTYNINKLISYINGARTIEELEDCFDTEITDLLVAYNRMSEDAIEFRASVYGNPYIKKYWKSNHVKNITSSQRELMDQFSNGVTIAFGVVDVLDTIMSISRVNANEKLFVEDMEFLNNLSLFGNDLFVRSAARDVMNCLKDEYIETYSSAIYRDAMETVGELAIIWRASSSAYEAVVIAVRDSAILASGIDRDLEQLYSIYCYSSMTSIYVKMSSWNLQPGVNNKYYSCYETNVGFSTRCIRNIAQLRVLGENEYYEYIKNDGLFGGIVDFVAGLDDVKVAVENNMVDVKSVTDAMRIKLSSNLMYSVQ